MHGPKLKVQTPIPQKRIQAVKAPQKAKQREQKVVIIVSSPKMGFGSVEKDLLEWSKAYQLRPYAYALVSYAEMIMLMFSIFKIHFSHFSFKSLTFLPIITASPMALAHYSMQ